MVQSACPMHAMPHWSNAHTQSRRQRLPLLFNPKRRRHADPDSSATVAQSAVVLSMQPRDGSRSGWHHSVAHLCHGGEIATKIYASSKTAMQSPKILYIVGMAFQLAP